MLNLSYLRLFLLDFSLKELGVKSFFCNQALWKGAWAVGTWFPIFLRCTPVCGSLLLWLLLEKQFSTFLTYLCKSVVLKKKCWGQARESHSKTNQQAVCFLNI